MRKLYILSILISMLLYSGITKAYTPPTTDDGHITLVFGAVDPIFMDKGKTKKIDNLMLKGVRPGDYFFISCVIGSADESEPSIFQFLDKDEQPLPSLPQLTLTAISTKLAITPDNIDDVKKIGAVYGKNIWIHLLQVSRDVLRGISIDKSKATMKPGSELVLEGAPIPRNSFFLVGWESSDESVATVDAGVVHANAIGNAVITTYIVGAEDERASCKIEVTRDGQPGSAVETIDGEEENVTVYNTQGIRLLDNAPAEELKNLPAGLYIINGKKTLIR